MISAALYYLRCTSEQVVKSGHLHNGELTQPYLPTLIVVGLVVLTVVAVGVFLVVMVRK